MDNQLSEQEIQDRQNEYLKQAMEEGSIFEDFAKHKGWAMVLNNYQNDLRLFINELMLSDKPITEFENKRNELKGIRKLVGRVDNAIKVVLEEREKQANAKPEDTK